jgi:hypothetical protein
MSIGRKDYLLSSIHDSDENAAIMFYFETCQA